MSKPMWEVYWPGFRETLESRLSAGYREYGDESFAQAPDRTVSEIQEEILDICGWSFILYVPLEKLKEEMP